MNWIELNGDPAQCRALDQWRWNFEFYY